MSLLDVSEVLFDPDFADPLRCERSSQIVGSNGIAVTSVRVLPLMGIVTNDAGDVLRREAAGERIIGNIVVHTAFRLIAGEPGITADVILWNRRRYTVAKLNDYSHFGRGFTAASCDLIP